jgi:outer membrane protein assembly factor BamB
LYRILTLKQRWRSGLSLIGPRQNDWRAVGRHSLAQIASSVCIAACLSSSEPLVAAGDGPIYPRGPARLDRTVRLARPKSKTMVELNRSIALLQSGRGDEAIGPLLKLIASSKNETVRVAKGRYQPVGVFARSLLVKLPPKLVDRYRAETDRQAADIFKKALARHDTEALRKLVERFPLSSLANRALLANGDLALEAGDPALARFYWDQIIPIGTKADVDLSLIAARHILAMIAQGDLTRAEAELDRFTAKFPQKTDRLTDQEPNWSDRLQKILANARQFTQERPGAKKPDDWPTFAGNFQRDKKGTSAPDTEKTLWQIDLKPINWPTSAAWPPKRPIDPALFPVVDSGGLFINRGDSIRAFNLETGQPLWGNHPSVYRSDNVDSKRLPDDIWGMPRQSLSVYSDRYQKRLYARVGPPVVGRTGRNWSRIGPNRLVCLDLLAEGRLVWSIEPPGTNWAFEGAPVADGRKIWVALRRQEICPELHVACYDSQTGKPLWQTMVAGAETASAGYSGEYSDQLLTRSGQTIYCNTHLGAIAALSSDTGRIRWITEYQREENIDRAQLAPYQLRSQSPLLFDRGRLFAAPADSKSLLCLRAFDGQIEWENNQTPDAIHLLGIVGEKLIVTGDRVYWLGLGQKDSGKLIDSFPSSTSKLTGFARGTIAGDKLYWPTLGSIEIIDGDSAKLVRSIDLKQMKIQSGNLLSVNGRLLITGTKQMTLLGTTPEIEKPSEKK